MENKTKPAWRKRERTYFFVCLYFGLIYIPADTLTDSYASKTRTLAHTNARTSPHAHTSPRVNKTRSKSKISIKVHTCGAQAAVALKLRPFSGFVCGVQRANSTDNMSRTNACPRIDISRTQDNQSEFENENPVLGLPK